jgi:hypothetical protein
MEKKIFKIGFVILILLIFSPLTFLIANTIVSNVIVDDYKDCYLDYPPKLDMNTEELNTRTTQNKECEDYNANLRKEKGTLQFIIVSIISIIAIILILLIMNKLDDVINYGIFFGAGLNTIVILLINTETNSFLSIGLGVLLFVLIIVFINRKLRKK